MIRIVRLRKGHALKGDPRGGSNIDCLRRNRSAIAFDGNILIDGQRSGQDCIILKNDSIAGFGIADRSAQRIRAREG